MNYNDLGTDERAMIIREANSFVVWNLTVRELANAEKVSKSTMYNRLVIILPQIDYPLYLKVRKVLDKNKRERSKHGGMKNKERCLRENLNKK